MIKIIVLLLVSCACQMGIAQSKDTFLVKPYLQFGTKNGMYILWENGDPTTGYVEYTKAKFNTDKIVFDKKTISNDLTTLHEVHLTSLEVSTKYIYRVVSIKPNGDSIISDISTFKTNVNDEDAFMFVLIGDTQRNNKTPWALGKIAERAWELRPNFLVLAGDLVDQGNKKTDWTTHFFPYGNVVMKRYPVYSVLGNHEQDSKNYYDYMVNPAPEYHYTFNYGNAQFFMIDTNRDVKEGSEQYDWLEWALSESTAKWKFVVHHHPPYSSDSDDHGDSFIGLSTQGGEARNLVPLYEKYGVDFCLFGHTHLYERTYPVLNNNINHQNGVVYINSGGAGGGLEDFDPVRNWFTKELRVTHHLCTFQVFEDQIEFKAIDHNGQVFDSYFFTKENKSLSLLNPPAPKIEVDKLVFKDNTNIDFKTLNNKYKVRYTIDGSEPDSKSHLYTSTLNFNSSTKIKAATFDEQGHRSRIVEKSIIKMLPKPSLNISKVNQGLTYKYYEGNFHALPDFKTAQPINSGQVKLISLNNIEHREDQFAVVYEGYIDIATENTYNFYTYSDDGSRMYIDDELLIDADGKHSLTYFFGTTILDKGLHKIKIEYFEYKGSQEVSAGILSKSGEKIPFTPFQLKH